MQFVGISIEESNDTETMTVDQLMRSLQAYAERLINKEESDSQVLKTNVSVEDRDKVQQSHGRGHISGQGRSRGRGSTFVRGRGRSGERIPTNNDKSNNYARGRGNFSTSRNRYDKSSVQCYTCQKYGHYAYECRSTNEEWTHYVEAEEDEELLLLVASKEERKREVWYLDTGAANHMSGNKELFSTLNESVQGNIIFGDDTKAPIKGKGDVLVRSKNGTHLLISQVYYVPGLKSNILSLGQLLERGYEMYLKDKHLTLMDCSRRLITKVPMEKKECFCLILMLIIQSV